MAAPFITLVAAKPAADIIPLPPAPHQRSTALQASPPLCRQRAAARRGSAGARPSTDMRTVALMIPSSSAKVLGAHHAADGRRCIFAE